MFWTTASYPADGILGGKMLRPGVWWVSDFRVGCLIFGSTGFTRKMPQRQHLRDEMWLSDSVLSDSVHSPARGDELDRRSRDESGQPLAEILRDLESPAV